MQNLETDEKYIVEGSEQRDREKEVGQCEERKHLSEMLASILQQDRHPPVWFKKLWTVHFLSQLQLILEYFMPDL